MVNNKTDAWKDDVDVILFLFLQITTNYKLMYSFSPFIDNEN